MLKPTRKFWDFDHNIRRVWHPKHNHIMELIFLPRDHQRRSRTCFVRLPCSGLPHRRISSNVSMPDIPKAQSKELQDKVMDFLHQTLSTTSNGKHNNHRISQPCASAAHVSISGENYQDVSCSQRKPTAKQQESGRQELDTQQLHTLSKSYLHYMIQIKTSLV